MEPRLKNVAWGIGYLSLYALVLQPLIVRLLHGCIGIRRRNGGAGNAALVGVAMCSLFLPLAVPAALTLVRAFYGMLAITTLQKLVSYLKERRGPPSDVESRQEFTDFMNGYTTNFTERPARLAPGEETPDPRRLTVTGLLRLGAIALVAMLNVKLELWAHTPPLGASLVKCLLFVLFLTSQRDLAHAALIRAGFRPTLNVVDLRLFLSDTYEKVLLRLNPTTHRWLLRYVYRPLGGRAHHVRNTFLSYALSGLWHEYLLVVASMKITGLWFAYFAVNGLIVCVESQVKTHRDALFERLGTGPFAYVARRRVLPVANFLLNVCVAHLVFLGLESVVRFH